MVDKIASMIDSHVAYGWDDHKLDARSSHSWRFGHWQHVEATRFMDEMKPLLLPYHSGEKKEEGGREDHLCRASRSENAVHGGSEASKVTAVPGKSVAPIKYNGAQSVDHKE
ncbi:hypothetical protein RRG08_009316 [Elysia crispata]|uniref:Uncharacterized protein n=1 Tax=Elysia crispata TaxID=231223 RepID=A0AAE1CLC4_9GAST|nr:hypothetical protein RRG08_009316 [Elysia crispata]